MNYGDRILDDMAQLLAVFAPNCADRSTLDEVAAMIGQRRLWPRAHDLFDRIRDKTLKAERAGRKTEEAQYLFEEICAKTLYNLTNPTDHFDADSPYWIVPVAFALARTLGIDRASIVEIVAAP
jgi:hypothetical protein